MAKRHPNYKLAKIHRNYTVEEIANLFKVHRNTVRTWIKCGLQTIDNKRPTLILGQDIGAFLRERRLKNKRACRPGEIYCVRCRTPQKPLDRLAEYKPMTNTLGTLIGTCPDCKAKIYRRINPAKLNQIHSLLHVTLPQVRQHISERASPSVNSDFNQDVENHENSQSK